MYRYRAIRLVAYDPGLPLASEGSIGRQTHRERCGPRAAMATRGPLFGDALVCAGGNAERTGEYRLCPQRTAAVLAATISIGDSRGAAEGHVTAVLGAAAAARLLANFLRGHGSGPHGSPLPDVRLRCTPPRIALRTRGIVHAECDLVEIGRVHMDGKVDVVIDVVARWVVTLRLAFLILPVKLGLCLPPLVSQPVTCEKSSTSGFASRQREFLGHHEACRVLVQQHFHVVA